MDETVINDLNLRLEVKDGDLVVRLTASGYFREREISSASISLDELAKALAERAQGVSGE